MLAAARDARLTPVARGSPQRGRMGVLIVALLVIAWSIAHTVLSSNGFVNPGGAGLLRDFFAAALAPDLSADFLWLTLDAARITMTFAVCGLAISLLIGFAGGVLSSEVWHGNASRLRWLTRIGLAAPRAIHEVLWALIFVITLGLDPLAAVLALGIPFGAITAKVFAEILDEAPRVAFNSLRNAGAPRAQAMLYGLLPQALPNLLSYAFYRFECALRSSAVLGVVGAGGLGYQLLLSLQSLRYAQIWTLLYALLLLSGLTDLFSAQMRRWLDTPTRLSLTGNNACAPHARQPIRANHALRWLAIGMLLASIVSFATVGADWSRLWSARTAANITRLGNAIGTLQLDLVTLSELVRLSVQTLAMAVLAIAIAGVSGLVLSYLAAQRHGRGTQARGLLPVLGARGLLLFCRALPAPVWALLLLFVLFPGPLPGALAIALHNLGILGRLMAEAVENLDPRPLQALRNAGAPASHTFAYAVLPASVPQSVAYALYRWEVCTRETVIVGLVGAGGLGRLIQEQLSSFDYAGLLLSLIALFVITFVVDALSGAARRALR